MNNDLYCVWFLIWFDWKRFFPKFNECIEDLPYRSQYSRASTINSIIFSINFIESNWLFPLLHIFNFLDYIFYTPINIGDYSCILSKEQSIIICSLLNFISYGCRDPSILIKPRQLLCTFCFFKSSNLKLIVSYMYIFLTLSNNCSFEDNSMAFFIQWYWIQNAIIPINK